MKHTRYVTTLCILIVASVLFAQTAVSQSCCALRGNINGAGGIDISDLTYLVAYQFGGGPPPPCMEEGNVNGVGGIDISDLTYLVSYQFGGGPVPPPCPENASDVFVDEYGSGVTYQAFAGSLLDAVQVSADSAYAGTQGLEITIPGSAPFYSGGAFVDTSTASRVGPRNLTAFNALTFWAKADIAATLDVCGVGNDNTGTSMYTAEVTGLALTTTWQQYVIPIPAPQKLTAERGLFFFAEGEGLDYTIWMDEIAFDSLTTITNPRPAIVPQTLDVDSGATIVVGNGSVIFDVGGTDVTVSAMQAYFDFQSSDPSVVEVGMDGSLTAVGVGSATLTATLDGTAATGSVTVNVTVPAAEPMVAAPTPTQDPGDVISLFSDAYTDVPVDTWSAGWDAADLEDFLIGSDSTKKYTNLSFAGVEFTTTTVDATAMTHFHMDVWTPDATAAPAVFKIKLVDFGADGAFGGGDDVEHELTFDETTMDTESWVSIDVPLASFAGLTTTGHLAQMIISGDPNTVYVDNVYFYDSGAPLEPASPAPTPTQDPGDVVSLYSDAYTPATTVDTWSAVWDDADVADVVISSDNAKKYTNLVFAGIEFTTSPLDASAMDHFHMDVWTPDPTAAPAVFLVKLVDFGADGAFGGGDDVEHELTFDEATMNTGLWTSIDVPLTDFAGLTTKAHIAQMIISGDPNTLWVDNIYFYDSGVPTVPTTPAPTPTVPAIDVISLFSDAYTDVTVDTWSAVWDDADVSDYMVGSDNTKQYSNFVFAGIEFTSSPIDASTMTHFHMDVWTPDPTAAPAEFRIKLVDFGADGAFGGGDDVEHELIFGEATMNTGSWVSFEIPLTDFTGLTTKGHLAQMVLVSTPNTVFVDNVYLHK